MAYFGGKGDRLVLLPRRNLAYRHLFTLVGQKETNFLTNPDLLGVTLVVRGAPVLNDATLADVHTMGLDQIVEAIDNGSDAPGKILNDCSQDFRRRFAQADLIIAKGQGNFETLSNELGNIFFLFKVKCSVIANIVNQPMGLQLM